FIDVVAERWRVPLGRAVAQVSGKAPMQVMAVGTTADKGADPDEARVQPLRSGDGAVSGVLITVEGPRQPDQRLSEQLQMANAEGTAANEGLGGHLDQLRHAHRLDDERTRFLAMLAHELRNPLAAITSALYLLRRQRVAAGDRMAEQALRVAERQSKSQARMLEDLLDASRLVLGKITLRPVPTDFGTIVRHAIDSADFGVRSRAHTLQAELPDEAVVIMGDSVRLEQIVANLLGNAVKYTPVGGQINVTLSTTPETATLIVSDTGNGIEAPLLERVFDLFTQADGSRSRVAGGHDIGLTVARHLVELHGGTIEARSAGRGKGSTFEVRLPRMSAKPVADSQPTTRPRPPARRILVVDDNRDAREMLRQILELDGHQVQEAAEGNQAVRLAAEWTPAVALIDIGLPEIDGYEVARRIRKRLGAAVRLVALTGYGDPEARRLATEAGFDEHLVKPIDPDMLADFLRAA